LFLTAPTQGKVSLNKTYTSCIDRCSLTAEFNGFKDEESGIESCEFSIKTVNEVTVTPAEPTTSENQAEAKYLTLQHGESCKVAVACYNTVGERSLDVLSPRIRIDNTPTEKVRRVSNVTRIAFNDHQKINF
jgi:uncharacterized DUF497 family protein